MNDSNTNSSKRTLLWLLVVAGVLAVMMMALLGGFLLHFMGQKTSVSMPAPAIPSQTASSGFTPIDLTAHYDKSASWTGASAWEVVPHGPATLGGVLFNVDGLLRLAGTGDSTRSYREKVEGIAVGRKFGRLHLLHLTGAAGQADTPYARVILRYADESTASFTLVYGKHARYWHRSTYEYPSALSDPNSKVVWRGTHESTPKTLRLFKTTFENPKPDQEVATIDLISEVVTPNAVILAMSVGPSNLPRPEDDPPSLPEPEEPYDGQIKFSVVDADTGKPLPNVKLKISGSETGGSFRAPEVKTDASGTALVRHPGDTTRTLTVTASGDGIAVKSVRWQQSAGDVIPEEHTLRVGKGVTIGGVVRDEAGQPVGNVKISLSGLGTPGDQPSRDRLPFSQIDLTNDTNGRWDFRSLPQDFGSFNVTVSHPDYIEGRFLSDGVDRAYVGERVKMETLRQTNAVFTLRKGLAVTGRVLTDTGEPIIGAKLLLGDSRFTRNPVQARTDDRGEFRLAGASLGTTYLTVQASGRAPQMQQINVGAKMNPVEFRLAPGRVLKVKVVDEFDTPVRSARVTVDMWQNYQTIDLGGSTDSRGQLTLNSAPEAGMSGSIYKAGYMSMGGIQFVANGEEQRFILRKSAVITGTVTDADSKEPIESFDVTRGQSSGGDQIYWQTYNITKGNMGAFSVRLDQQGITALQIEADDHLPAIINLATNGETHYEVQLKKGSGPKGIVQTPDGKPAAGAQLAVLVKGKWIHLGAGKILNYGGSESRPVAADDAGAFSLRAIANGEKIIALHAQGYAETSYSNFVSGSTITLQPLGTIKGVLKIGTRPGTNESVLLTRANDGGFGGLQYGFEDFKATTDAEGGFSMASVPPGEQRLVRLIPLGERSWGHSHPQNVTIKPGEVTVVTMGGNGRAVIGKLTVNDPSRSIDWRQSGHHSLNYYPKPPPFKGIEEYRAWENLPETVAARKNVRSYALQLQEDGSFRIDDVLAGSYDLQIHLTEGNDPRGSRNTIGTLSTNIVIPEIPDAPAAPPLDLGTFEIPVTGRPQRNAALR